MNKTNKTKSASSPIKRDDKQNLFLNRPAETSEAKQQ